jgi:hypothetical protein
MQHQARKNRSMAVLDGNTSPSTLETDTRRPKVVELRQNGVLDIKVSSSIMDTDA